MHAYWIKMCLCILSISIMMYPRSTKYTCFFCWLISAEFPELSQLNWLRKNTVDASVRCIDFESNRQQWPFIRSKCKQCSLSSCCCLGNSFPVFYDEFCLFFDCWTTKPRIICKKFKFFQIFFWKNKSYTSPNWDDSSWFDANPPPIA